MSSGGSADKTPVGKKIGKKYDSIVQLVLIMINIHEIIPDYIPERLLTSKERWQSLQKVFLTLRDIPYGAYQSSVPLKTLDEYLNNFLAQGIGACSPKHFLLGLMCEKIGMQVEYLSHYFFWQNIPLKYPEELRIALCKMPAQLHTSLAISLFAKEDEEKYSIDCTWDLPLEAAGFPVNRLGNSPNNCNLGIIPHSTPIIHRAAEDKWLFLQRTKSMMPPNQYTSLFYKGLNEWMIAIRSKPNSCDQQDNNNSPISDRLSLIAVAQFENS